MKDLYDFYESGYNNSAYQFAYVPEFDGIETIKAYSMGSIDGKLGFKKTIEDFEASINV